MPTDQAAGQFFIMLQGRGIVNRRPCQNIGLDLLFDGLEKSRQLLAKPRKRPGSFVFTLNKFKSRKTTREGLFLGLA